MQAARLLRIVRQEQDLSFRSSFVDMRSIRRERHRVAGSEFARLIDRPDGRASFDHNGVLDHADRVRGGFSMRSGSKVQEVQLELTSLVQRKHTTTKEALRGRHNECVVDATKLNRLMRVIVEECSEANVQGLRQ